MGSDCKTVLPLADTLIFETGQGSTRGVRKVQKYESVTISTLRPVSVNRSIVGDFTRSICDRSADKQYGDK